MVTLRKMYLSIHALDWFDLAPGGQTVEKYEQFPGRCEFGYRNDVKLKERVYQLIRTAKDDEGIFILPNGRRTPTRDDIDPESQALIAFAEKHFGPRCVVCRYDADWNQIRRVLGECAERFFNGLEEDRRQAMMNRGLPERELAATYDTAPEFRAWALSKAWVFDLARQLEERGYTFDPADVEFVVSGTPIDLGRLIKANKPIVRVNYRLQEKSKPDLEEILTGMLKKKGLLK